MTETNKPIYAIEHTLETYDGISASDIDYNNIADTRYTWRVGRQLLERKNSNEYLKEMFEQCFISAYPTRDGKRGIKAWRDDDTIIATHDESKISKDSSGKPLIYKYEKIPINKVYNDIELNYDWNPGLKKFNKTMFVTNASETAFPDNYVSTGTDTSRSFTAIVFTAKPDILEAVFTVASSPTWATVGTYVSFIATDRGPALFGIVSASDTTTVTVSFDLKYGGSGTSAGGVLWSHTSSIPKWTTYVGGVPDYTTAQIYWNQCKNAYDETQVVNSLKLDCTWLIDESKFGETEATASYLLSYILEWNVFQKYITQYALPITADNLQLELCDPITFNDQKYTNGADRNGYIKEIKIIPSVKKPMIVITLILIPFNLVTDNIIKETGSNTDLISESGSRTDVISEGNQ